jgi:hypothetical protein
MSSFEDDATADDLIAGLLGTGTGTGTGTGADTSTASFGNAHAAKRETLSQQLGWLRDGLPRSLWKPLTSRASGILLGEVALLRPYFVDQALVTSARCSCSQCDELFAAPVALPCAHTFCSECVEDAAACPLCHAPLQLDADGRPVHATPVSLVALLAGAVLTCPLGDCDWRGTLDGIVGHVEHHCEYRPLQCPFVKCRAMLVRCQLPMHEKLCENRSLGTKEEKRRLHAAERAALKAATGSDLPPWGGAVDADTHDDGVDAAPVASLGPPPLANQYGVVPVGDVTAARAAPPPTAPLRSTPMPPLPRRTSGSPVIQPRPARPQASPPPLSAAARPAPSRTPARRTGPPPRPGRGAPPQAPAAIDEDAPAPVVLPADVRALPPTAPPRPTRPKRSTLLLEEAPLVLEETPTLDESSPASHAMQRMSVLVGNIGALQMKLKEQALAVDEREMYASELKRAMDDQSATQMHLQRHAPDLLVAPSTPMRAPPPVPVAARRSPPEHAARRAPIAVRPAAPGGPHGFRLPPLDAPSAAAREQPPAMPPRPAQEPPAVAARPVVHEPHATPTEPSHEAMPLRRASPGHDTPGFSRPMDVKRNPEAVAALLAAAGLDVSVLDRSSSVPVSEPLSPRRTDIGRPMEVRRNPDAVKALLASAGVDASVLERDSRSFKTDASDAPLSDRPVLAIDVSAPTNVQRNPEAVRAMLAQAGYDPSLLQGASSTPKPKYGTLDSPPAKLSDGTPKFGTLDFSSMPLTPQIHQLDVPPTKNALPSQLAQSPRRGDASPRPASPLAVTPREEAYSFDEPPVSPRLQKRLWVTHKDSSKQATLHDYEKLYRDTGAAATTADADVKPKPPPGAPPSAVPSLNSSGRTSSVSQSPVFVDVDVLLPGNELLMSVTVAWNTFATKVRVHRDELLVATRDHIVSTLAGRGLLPAHGDANVERYQLVRGDGPRRGARVDLRMSSVGNELAHLASLVIEDSDSARPPPPPPSTERPKTPRGETARTVAAAATGAPPPPPPPEDDEESWSDSESGGSDGEAGEPNDQLRRTSSSSRRSSSQRRASPSVAPFSPAVDALLTLARMKLHNEVERLLPTLSSEERHAFKAEIRRRRDERKRRESGSKSRRR